MISTRLRGNAAANRRQGFLRGDIGARLVLGAMLLFPALGATAGGTVFIHAQADGAIEISDAQETTDFRVLISSADLQAAPVDVLIPRSGRGKIAGQTFLAQGVERFRAEVAEASRQSRVDARLIHAVIAAESGFNPHAVSRAGAIGLMQLMPGTARRFGVRDSRDPAQNLMGGARYLSYLLDFFQNDIALALAAYNAGEGAVLGAGRKIPAFSETLAYVPRVLEIYRRLESLRI
jgi:soluble lytic murein transglycosylase-like protein